MTNIRGENQNSEIPPTIYYLKSLIFNNNKIERAAKKQESVATLREK